MTDQARVKSLVRVQAYTVLIMAICSVPLGLTVVRDVVLGGAAAILGSVALACWVFSRYRAARLGALIKQFYIGELVRLIVIMVAFFAAMQGFDDLNPAALFVAFFIVQVIPMVLVNKYMH